MTREEMAAVCEHAEYQIHSEFGVGDIDYDAELFQVAAELRKMTWQPIETAPKDGTVILAFNGKGITAIEWCYDAWNLSETHDYPEDTRWEYPPPTHWMPLPEPPAGVR